MLSPGDHGGNSEWVTSNENMAFAGIRGASARDIFSPFLSFFFSFSTFHAALPLLFLYRRE
jgi:hypothetical protein